MFPLWGHRGHGRTTLPSWTWNDRKSDFWMRPKPESQCWWIRGEIREIAWKNKCVPGTARLDWTLTDNISKGIHEKGNPAQLWTRQLDSFNKCFLSTYYVPAVSSHSSWGQEINKCTYNQMSGRGTCVSQVQGLQSKGQHLLLSGRSKMYSFKFCARFGRHAWTYSPKPVSPALTGDILTY